MKGIHLIKVVSVSEEKTDKNGRIYKTVEFTNPETIIAADENSGEIVSVRVDPKRCGINRYKESYLNDKQEFMFDAIIGEKTPGIVVSQPVAPYEIDGRTVDSYTTVVFGDTNSKLFENWTIQAFRNAGHDISKYKTPQQIEDELVNDNIEDKKLNNVQGAKVVEPAEAPKIPEPSPETDNIVATAENVVAEAVEEVVVEASEADAVILPTSVVPAEEAPEEPSNNVNAVVDTTVVAQAEPELKF